MLYLFDALYDVERLEAVKVVQRDTALDTLGDLEDVLLDLLQGAHGA